jgi:hypothetical protein
VGKPLSEKELRERIAESMERNRSEDDFDQRQANERLMREVEGK